MNLAPFGAEMLKVTIGLPFKSVKVINVRYSFSANKVISEKGFQVFTHMFYHPCHKEAIIAKLIKQKEPGKNSANSITTHNINQNCFDCNISSYVCSSLKWVLSEQRRLALVHGKHATYVCTTSNEWWLHKITDTEEYIIPVGS